MDNSILIVEDENIVAQDIEISLKNLGYQISGISSTGIDAIKKANEMHPSLVLMDIKLKGDMDGIETAKKINSKYEIPIIFLTAYSDNEILKRVRHASAFGYIVKPFTEAGLNSSIQTALGKYNELKKNASNEDSLSLSLFDKKILGELIKNSRSSTSRIGKSVRLPKSTVNYRIKKLIEGSYINKFYTLFNTQLLGYNYYKFLIKFNKTSPEIEKAIIDFVKEQENCFELCITQGGFNLILITVHKSDDDLRDFFEKLSANFGEYLIDKDVSAISQIHLLSHSFSMNSKESSPYETDKIDLKIIRSLASNARVNLIDLAHEIKTDWRRLRYRIKKMENQKLIVSYTTDLNVSKMNKELVHININLKDSRIIPKAIEFFKSTGTCQQVYVLTGHYDMLVKLSIKNNDELKVILDKFQELFSNNYISYDVNYISRNELLNSIPNMMIKTDSN